MRKVYSVLLVSFFVLSFYGIASAQLLLENFDYGTSNNADITTVSSWIRHSGAQGPTYEATGLSYTGYIASGIGGAIGFTHGSSGTNDGDAHLSFSDSVSTTSSVYVSFLVNLSAAQATADYFFHLGPKNLGTTFRGRVFAVANGAGWSFGLSKSSDTRTDDNTVLNFNQTYLVVLKYDFNSTAADDDQVTLYVYDSGVPATEPGSPIVTIGPVGSGTSGDPSDIGAVAIREGSNTPTGTVDGIRVDTTWNFAAAADNTFPLDSLRVNDSNGSPVKLNDTVNTTGIVTAILELGTGTSGPGAIQNDSAGMSIYGNTFTQTPGLKRGDSVLVEDWKLTQYSGLTELSYTSTSSVTILSSGHDITPLVVTIPQIKGQAFDSFEKYESKLIQVNGVHFVQTGVFDVGTSSGVNYQIFNGADTLDLRIVKTNTSLIGKNIPTGDLNVVGVLTQYKYSAPYEGGYQLLPRDSADIAILTAVENTESKPFTYQLYQNYPNPFNPSTKIKFEVPKSEKVVLKVYDILGREVATLYNAVAPAGLTTINFNASNLATGVYIYTIKTAETTISKKLMLLK